MEKNNASFSKNILSTLQERNIHPRSRWWFVARSIAVWIAAGIVGIAAGFAMGTVIFLVVDHDWDIAQYVGRPFFLYAIESIPYVWIVLCVLLIAFLYQNIRSTERGYVYETSRLMMISILGSACVGTLLFVAGFNAKAHNALLAEFPWYGSLIYEKHDIWTHPEQGLLSGVVEVTSTDGFLVRDEEDSLWNILVSTTTAYQKNAIPKPGEIIKIIGTEVASTTFKADQIRLWGE